MTKSIRLFLLAAGLMAAPGAIYAQGQQIYTWTDENGVVHYVDTPPDHRDATSMDAPEAYRPGSADAYPDQDAVDSIAADDPGNEEVSATDNPANEEASYADQKREQLAQQREQQLAARAELRQNCTRAREQLANLEPSRAVFFTNAQGETERLDDEERARRVAETRVFIAKNCD